YTGDKTGFNANIRNSVKHEDDETNVLELKDGGAEVTKLWSSHSTLQAARLDGNATELRQQQGLSYDARLWKHVLLFKYTTIQKA
ncbi:hypothetical protein E2562_014147, partial [Oryza meyeriana var. granulata]